MSRLSDFFRGVDGAASSGAPINSVANLNVPEDVNFYIDSDEGEWLRNGHFITSSFTSYPNALTSSNITSFNIFAEKKIDTTADSGRGNGYFTLKPDGTTLYIQGTVSTGNGGVSIYSLSTAWDISTSTYVTGSPIGEDPGLDNGSAGIFFDNTGTFLFQNDVSADFVKYTLSSAYNLTSFTSTSLVTNGVGIGQTYRPAKISSDGLHIYSINTSTNTTLVRSELDAAYATTTTVNNSDSVNITNLLPSYFGNDTSTETVRDFAINTDGTRMIFAVTSDIFVGDTMLLLCEMTTPHNLQTMSLIKYEHLSDYSITNMHFDYTLTNGILKGTTKKASINYFSVDLSDSIGIPKNQNKNLFLKVK